MREKDIKKIFDTYCGSSEKAGKAEVSSERVKASVLEKIGMSAAESFYTDSQGEEPVKPVFVAVTKKKRDGAAIKIAAWAGAAACLVAVVMSMGLFGGNRLKTLLLQKVDENNIKPLESVAETSQNVNMDLFDGDRVFRLPLMDGMIFTYSGNEEFNYDHSEIEWFDVVPFLYEKDNRLYFAASNDGWGIVDITDKIGREDFYLYSYENPNNNINTTHYLLIGGDVSEGKYGYMEIFKVKNSTNTWGFVGGFSYEYVSGNKFCDPVDPDAKWLVNGINYLNEKYSIATDPTKNNVGCCRLSVDFKYKDYYQYGNTEPDLLQSLQLTLLDGSLIELYYGDSSVHTVSNPHTKKLLFKENDRLFFNNGKGYKEDITDKLNSDGFYVYVYENPQNPFDKTHYVVAGGDLSKNYYGYWEVYQGGVDSWDKSGTFNCGSFDGDIENPQWAYDAAKFLKEEYGAELPLIGVYATDNIN